MEAVAFGIKTWQKELETDTQPHQPLIFVLLSEMVMTANPVERHSTGGPSIQVRVVSGKHKGVQAVWAGKLRFGGPNIRCWVPTDHFTWIYLEGLFSQKASQELLLCVEWLMRPMSLLWHSVLFHSIVLEGQNLSWDHWGPIQSEILPNLHLKFYVCLLNACK